MSWWEKFKNFMKPPGWDTATRLLKPPDWAEPPWIEDAREEAVDVALSEIGLPLRPSKKILISEKTFRKLVPLAKSYLGDPPRIEVTDVEIVSAIRSRGYDLKPEDLGIPMWLILSGLGAYFIVTRGVSTK